MRWVSPGRWPSASSSWTSGEIVEDAQTVDFFGKPRSERAQAFLSKILAH